jgi:disulfide oxidoreductase YuzD
MSNSPAEATIHITILNNTRKQECDAACGEDWSLPETIALANQRIKDRFGDRAKLEYLDLPGSAGNQKILEWNRLIKNKNLSLPLLLVNGEIRISGQFDIRQLLDVVDAEIEIGARS